MIEDNGQIIYTDQEEEDFIYEATPEVKDHIETYKLYLDDWNSGGYKPSFLFGYQEKLLNFIRKHLDSSMEIEEIFKYIFALFGGAVVLILILAL